MLFFYARDGVIGDCSGTGAVVKRVLYVQARK